MEMITNNKHHLRDHLKLKCGQPFIESTGLDKYFKKHPEWYFHDCMKLEVVNGVVNLSYFDGKFWVYDKNTKYFTMKVENKVTGLLDIDISFGNVDLLESSEVYEYYNEEGVKCKTLWFVVRQLGMLFPVTDSAGDIVESPNCGK